MSKQFKLVQRTSTISYFQSIRQPPEECLVQQNRIVNHDQQNCDNRLCCLSTFCPIHFIFFLRILKSLSSQRETPMLIKKYCIRSFTYSYYTLPLCLLFLPPVSPQGHKALMSFADAPRARVISVYTKRPTLIA